MVGEINKSESLLLLPWGVDTIRCQEFQLSLPVFFFFFKLNMSVGENPSIKATKQIFVMVYFNRVLKGVIRPWQRSSLHPEHICVPEIL